MAGTLYYWRRENTPHFFQVLNRLAQSREVRVRAITPQIPWPRRPGIDLDGVISPSIERHDLEALTVADCRRLIDDSPADTLHLFANPVQDRQMRQAWRHCSRAARRFGWECALPGAHRSAVGRALRRLLFGGLARSGARRADPILCHGGMCVDFLRRSGFPAANLVSWGYFIDPPTTAPAAEALLAGPPRLVYAGQFIPRKNLIRLAEAWLDESPGSGAVLTLLGAGELGDRLAAMAARSGGSLVIGEALPQEELHREMALHDIFVLPSLQEEWGVVVNEAIALGLGVLCTDRAGAADLVRYASCGRLFSPVDDSAIRDSLRAVLADPGAVLRWKRTARRFAGCIAASTAAEQLGSLVLGAGSGRPMPWQAFALGQGDD